MTDLPEFIGSYKIIKKLGQGGFATVYLAHARDLDETHPVALKALDSTESYARFQREIETVANLSHPNIIRIFDTGEFENTTVSGENGAVDKPETTQQSGRLAKIWSGLKQKTKGLTSSEARETPAAVSEVGAVMPYFTMEYVPGGTLRDRLEANSALPRDEAMTLIKQIGAALMYAHEQGIIHRDVNPNNILLDTSQQPTRPILTDFGLVKPVTTDDDNLTVTLGLVGTFHYYAPEQWSRATLTPATDLYALGITFFEMLTGQRPFQGDIFHLRDKHLHEPLPPLSSLNPQASPFFDEVLSKATAKEPLERYQSVTAFIEALEAAQEKATDDEHYREVQHLLDSSAYNHALERLEQNFLRSGKYTYRDVSRLLWITVYASQHEGDLPPELSAASETQTTPLAAEIEFPAEPQVVVTQKSPRSHRLNQYFIPLALGVTLLMGAIIAPHVPDTLKTPPLQIAALTSMVICLFYYAWVYYVAPSYDRNGE